MKKIIILVFTLIAAAGGFLGGTYLHTQKKVEAKGQVVNKDENFEYSQLSKQLIVPILKGDKLDALLIADVWFEMRDGAREILFSKEPRVRDELLQIFYHYAAEGYFNEDLLSEKTQANLRADLTKKAQELIGKNAINAVLIMDLQRQNM